MININKDSRILTIAAHPDDEVLGCGGCVSKWSSFGATINALILAEGITSRGDKLNHTLQGIELLRQNALASAETIGYKTIIFEDLPDNRMDSIDLLDVIKIVSNTIEKLNPDIILTHHHADLNIDHRITFQAVITACRPLKSCSVKTIISFEIPSATEWSFPYYANSFSPNIFVDITKHIDNKLNAVKCYKTETCMAPHPRSPESLRAIATRWGSVIERPYAEAFELIRVVSI